MALKDFPIGVFDSGLGGLTVLSELRNALPNERFVYLGDTARTPYGTKGESTVVRYAQECAKFLVEEQVKCLVVACNTASAVALDSLKHTTPCPVVGTIAPAVESIFAVPGVQRIGVIGTAATIASGVYQNALLEQNPSLQVFVRACPLFVPLVEEGIYDGAVVDAVMELYLSDLREKGIEALLLGCTHYPLLSDRISQFFQGKVQIIECSKAVATWVKNDLRFRGLSVDVAQLGEKAEKYFVTDEVSRFNSLAGLFLDAGSISAVKINSLGEGTRDSVQKRSRPERIAI